jgi:hypothetical protein
VSDDRLGAAFFLPPSGEPAADWLRTVVARAGVEVAPDGGRPHEWGGLWVEPRALDLDHHRVLLLTFLPSQYHDRRVEEAAELERDGNLPLALAFRDACRELRPPVAFVVVLPWSDLDAYVAGQEQLVDAGDVDDLSWEGFGLLYLGEPLAAALRQEHLRGARDELPAEGGRLLFARSGAGRWV